MMTEKEKAAFKEGISSKVVIDNLESRKIEAKKNMAAAKRRSAEILTKHQNKEMVRSILWFCRKLNIDAGELSKRFGFPAFLKSCTNDQLKVLKDDVKGKWSLNKNKL